MRQFLLSSLLVCAVVCAGAQDTIIKRNNDVIIAKILEIGTTGISYRQLNVGDTSVHTESKQNIAMLKMASGVKEVFGQQPAPVATAGYTLNAAAENKIDQLGNKYIYRHEQLSDKEAASIMLATGDRDIAREITLAEKARSYELVGLAAIPVGIAAAVFYAKANNIFGPANYNSNDSEVFLAGTAICVVAAVACPITSGVFRKIKAEHYHNAVRIYNERF